MVRPYTLGPAQVGGPLLWTLPAFDVNHRQPRLGPPGHNHKRIRGTATVGRMAGLRHGIIE